MKATIFQNNVVFVSDFTAEELNKLKNYKASALVKKNENKEPVFVIATGKTASINSNGICFNDKTEKGFAALTMSLPIDLAADKKEAYVQENYGYALLEANSMVEQIKEALTAVSAEFTEMKKQIKTVEA